MEEVGSGSIRLIYINVEVEALICQSHTASSCCVSRKIITITPLEDIPLQGNGDWGRWELSAGRKGILGRKILWGW